MDIQMPRMDGYTATELLRGLGLRIPIIAVTAHAFDDDRLRSQASGCDAHVSKPIDAGALVSAVREAVARAANAAHSEPADDRHRRDAGNTAA
jgi:CheY-like chemotaxis protein